MVFGGCFAVNNVDLLVLLVVWLLFVSVCIVHWLLLPVRPIVLFVGIAYVGWLFVGLVVVLICLICDL